MISFTTKGDFSHLEKFLADVQRRQYLSILDKYGKQGIAALESATPKDSGKTASSWSYEIVQNFGSSSIYFTNSNTNEGINIAIILQYGHGTGTGGYVEGRDYINPAIQPVFDQIVDAAWKEVTIL